MKDKEFVIEQRLRDIYYDPSTGFQSAERLYQMDLALVVGSSKNGLKLKTPTRDINLS